MPLLKVDTLINIQKINIYKFPNCIDLHMDMLKEHESCCFGRFGKRAASQQIVNPSGYILFYQHGRVFFSHVRCIETNVNKCECPYIYEELFFSNNQFPTDYLRLDYIREIDSLILEEIVYKGNKRIVSSSIGRCNNSFLTGILKKDVKL